MITVEPGSRKGTDNWFSVGSADEDTRTITANLSFMDNGHDADWKTNPGAYTIMHGVESKMGILLKWPP